MRSPSKTVKLKCQECLGFTYFDKKAIEDCKGDVCFTGGPCPLYPYRLGKRISVKMFRKYCIECMGGQPYLVANCSSTECAVYSYRFGKNPARTGIGGKGFNNDREQGKSARELTLI